MTENQIPIDIDHAKHSVGGIGGHFSEDSLMSLWR
jgi:hypothetical protein